MSTSSPRSVLMSKCYILLEVILFAFSCSALPCYWKSATVLWAALWSGLLRMALGNWDTQSNSLQQLDPANNHVRGVCLQVAPNSLKSWNEAAVLPCEAQSQRTQLRHFAFPDPQRPWDNKNIFFVHFVDILTIFLNFVQRIPLKY